jgi:uncharacterized membrane protein YhiD involved in acid resistance
VEHIWQIVNSFSSAGKGIFSPQSILVSLLLAFILGQVLAWVYYFTHSGLSYSKSFVQSLVLITVVVSMVMAVIGNSIITAFGLMGALAIVRFRNVLKDTRDIAFIFCALVVGMAAGSQNFPVAIVGTIILSLIAIYLHVTSFGSHQPHNGFLRFRLIGGMKAGNTIPKILKRFCTHFTMISAQDTSFGGAAEYAYQLMVRDFTRNEEMLYELEKVQGIENIGLTMQEELLEV